MKHIKFSSFLYEFDKEIQNSNKEYKSNPYKKQRKKNKPDYSEQRKAKRNLD